MADGTDDSERRDNRDRISFKSLDSEAMQAAQSAAKAAGLTLEEWLSRTIMRNATQRPHIVADPADTPAHNQGHRPQGGDSTGTTKPASPAPAGGVEKRVSVHIDRPVLSPEKPAPAAPATMPTFPEMPLAPSEAEHARLARLINDLRDDPAPSPPPVTPPPAAPAATTSARPLPTARQHAQEPLTLMTRSVDTNAAHNGNVGAYTGARGKENLTMASSPPEIKRKKRGFSWFWATVFVLLLLVAGAIWALPYLPKPASLSKNGTAPVSISGPIAGTKTPPSNPPKTGTGTTNGKTNGTVGNSTTSDPAAEREKLLRTPLRKMPRPASKHTDWYIKAAKAGNPNAQYILASLYLKGEGVEKSNETAAKWFRAAAEGGMAAAQYAMGVLYAQGIGVEKDPVEAALLFQKAADQGYVQAITQSGIAYLEGRGVARDPAKAKRFLERAAESNEVNAMYTLGRMYETGNGVGKNQVRALKWFILAAERKHRIAAQRVEALSSALKQSDQNRATDMAQEHNRRYKSER